MVAYAALLACVLIYPFHFSTPFANVDNAADTNATGAVFEKPGMLLSTAPAPRLHATLTNGSGLTVAVWFISQKIEQRELSRIFTYSLDPWRRNFALGQNGSRLYIRINLTTGGKHTDTLVVHTENVVRPGERQFVALTYDFNTLRIFVDGKERAAVDRPGHFLDWYPSGYLAVGNEVTGARPWLGTVEAAAIFDAAIPKTDVATLFRKGLSLKSISNANKLIAEFDFRNDANGNRTAKVVAPISMPNFERPARIRNELRLVYSMFRGADGAIQLTGSLSLWDLIRNVILFVPLGVFVCAKVIKTSSALGWVLSTALVVGVVVSATFEGLQIFIDERTSSIFDVAANSAGALIGATIARHCSLRSDPKMLN